MTGKSSPDFRTVLIGERDGECGGHDGSLVVLVVQSTKGKQSKENQRSYDLFTVRRAMSRCESS